MGVNAGRFHGVGVRPSFEPTLSGVALDVLHPGLKAIQATTIFNCAQFSTGQALVIQDTGSGRASGVHLLEVLNVLGADLFTIDGAGNAYVYDQLLGAGGVFGPFISFDGTTNPPSLNANGNRLYIASIAPTAQATAAANVNDWWYNSSATSAGNYFSSCTVAGTPGTWVGFI